MGKRIAARRQELGLTQAEAAERAGVSPGYWSRIETGSRTPNRIRSLERIADALDWTLEELMSC